MFRVELFRNSFTAEQKERSIGEASEKHRRSIGETSEENRRTEINNTQQKILELLSVDNELSANKMAIEIGVARRNIEANIRKLKEYGMLIRHGSPKNGYWEVINSEKPSVG